MEQIKKMFFIFIFIISSVLTSPVYSADLDFSWKKVDVALGAEYLSNIYKRGAVTYGSYQLIPIYSINLGTPDIQLVGSALTFRSFLIEDKLLFRSRLYFDSTLDRPLYFTAEKEHDRIRRETTNELDLFLEYRWKEKGELTGTISQDLSAHSGTYIELGARAILGNFIPKKKSSLLQPAFFATLGAGNKAHNKYLYGDNASSWDLTNYSYGISISSPAVIDIFYPVLKITRFGLLGKNKTASHIRSNEKEGWNITALFAFHIF